MFSKFYMKHLEKQILKSEMLSQDLPSVYLHAYYECGLVCIANEIIIIQTSLTQVFCIPYTDVHVELFKGNKTVRKIIFTIILNN